MDEPRALLPVALLLAGLCGCSSDLTVVTVEITVGLESDTFSKDPAVTRVDVEARGADGNVWTASASPGGSFDLGDVPFDARLSLEVTGFTSQGDTAVRGRSLVVPLDAWASEVIPVFAQRVNEWARPAGALARAHVGAPAGVLAERYLVATGGSSAVGPDGPADPAWGDFYDLLGYGGATSPTLPITARSLVARTSAMLLVGDQGASWADFAADSLGAVDPPAGLGSFAEVAGGAEIVAPDGVSYLVGATRASGATRAVLAVAADGSMTSLQLLQARQGAAAVWVEGTGLVVAGGSAIGPGVEVLAPGATAFAARDFPPDATEGAGAAVMAPGQVLLWGGQEAGAVSPARLLDPDCAAACAAMPVAGATFSEAIVQVSAFSLGGGRAIAIGRELVDPGLMRAFVVDTGSGLVTERMLREPRQDASVVAAPNGTLAILGGVHPDGSPALHVEMLFPGP